MASPLVQVALYQRLAQIVVELERLDAARWYVEREREQLRIELWRSNGIPPQTVPAA